MVGTKRTRVYTSLLATLCVVAATVSIGIFFKGGRRNETSIQHVAANDPKAILAEANHFAFLSNSYRAAPLYARAEAMFRQRGDKRDELYAKIGLMRAKAESMSFVKLADFIGVQLSKPIVRNDPNRTFAVEGTFAS